MQLAFGAGRGHAHFETGNTLASVLNGILAPLVVALLYGGGRQLQILTATLFAGVWATFSRGGAIALVMGLLVAIAVAGLPRSSWRRLPTIGLLFVTGGAVVALAIVASHWLPRWAEQGAVVALSLDSVKSRLELYELAWATTVFGWGIGYLAFRYVLELGRADVPSFGETSITYFVHNDYLQTLLELGVPGLAALLAMLVLAVRATMRAAPAREGQGGEASAILAGVLTYAFHATIDFPLHLPICLLLFGLGLGVIDRLSAPATDRHAHAGQAQRLVTLVLVIGLTVLLARPVIAEVAAAYAMKKWMVGETRAAAFGFELARRVDPGDWRYHLYAGQFWFAQAAENKEPEQARLADTAFAAGMAANPLDSSNALGRAVTHLTYASLLTAPAQPPIIRAWAEQALSVAPRNPAVRKEYEYIIKRLPPQ